MEDFQSKYSGEQVEAILDTVANGEAGGGGGGITVETDPVFSASPAASITEEKKAEWDNKVDKVSGKQLSTEDFTTALKTKLEELSNYDDTELSEALSTLRGDFDKLVSGDTTTAIKTFNEVIAFLDGIQDTQDLSGIIASIEQQIAGKQDTISDLNTLREKAEEGATIYRMVQEDKLVTPERMVGTIEDFIAQFENDVVEPIAIAVEGKVDSSSLATVATSGSYNDLSNKPTIPSAVTESTVSGWGFTKNKGTVTKVKINGSEKSPDSNGVVDLGTIEGGGGGSSSGGGMDTVVMDNYLIDYAEPNTIYVITTNGLGGGLEVYEFIPPTNGYAEYVFIFQVGVMDSGFSIPEYVMWPNGQLPDVVNSGDPSYGAVYELNISASLVDGGEYIYKAVLTHFKEAQW